MKEKKKRTDHRKSIHFPSCFCQKITDIETVYYSAQIRKSDFAFKTGREIKHLVQSIKTKTNYCDPL
jgi:hypothetical protein